MKFTIGTASSNMEFEEDYKLIKSALLYADEIELIGMAEYAIYNYLPKCFSNAKEIEKILIEERQRQLEVYAYLIFHNYGMKRSEKKRLILALDEKQGKTFLIVSSIQVRKMT